MNRFARIAVALVSAAVVVPGSAALATPAAGPAPTGAAATTAAPAAAAVTYPVSSVASLRATRANGEVVLFARAARIWVSTGTWGVYAAASGQLQYRPVGGTTWSALADVVTDARGTATRVDTSGLSREYRVYLRPTPYVRSGLSPVAAQRWCSVPAALVGKDLTRVPTTSKVVALTFDAGANADAVDSIVNTLRAKKVPATFFLTGRFATTFPSKTRWIMAQYPTGNHTATHPDLTTLTRAQAYAEIRQGQLQVRSVGGHDPHPYFRFPFGAVNAGLLDLVNDECYVSFRWTVDTLGWKGTSGGMTAAKVRDRVLAGLTPGEIVLMHVGSHPTDGSMLDAAALPGVIDAIRARGYSFVTLEAVQFDW